MLGCVILIVEDFSLVHFTGLEYKAEEIFAVGPPSFQVLAVYSKLGTCHVLCILDPS